MTGGRFLGSVRFLGVNGEVPGARHYIRGLLTRNGHGGAAGDAELLACECMSNAIRYTRSGAAGGQVAIKVVDLGGGVRVEVLDQGGAASVPAPRGRPDSIDAEDGRGLYLINALATEWGTAAYGPGTLTWFNV